ncbi:hypothetical protein [Microvirga rosea]|uniref:hypothetical protein n=1 Tax=Microvirga rosea TaxID=2715425 RepID=UPI001D0B758E|nr:hypothetical protein [Microvirga rosea]MCB8823190.1 hypothetical protein [Microvirga rosea]
MTEPRLYSGRQAVNITVGTVVEIVRMLDALGQAADFLRVHGEARVSVEPALVNAVKTFLASRDLDQQSPLAASIMGMNQDDCMPPYECPHIPRG